MDYSLDLIMNPLKTKKKLYHIKEIHETQGIPINDFILEQILNDVTIKHNIDDINLKKIIEKTIEIYSEYRPNKYINDIESNTIDRIENNNTDCTNNTTNTNNSKTFKNIKLEKKDESIYLKKIKIVEKNNKANKKITENNEKIKCEKIN